jgi:hypothetical protein
MMKKNNIFFPLLSRLLSCLSLSLSVDSHKDFHLLVESVVDEQIVRHADAVRLHRVRLPVVEVADFRWSRYALRSIHSALDTPFTTNRPYSRRNTPRGESHRF